MHIHLCMYGNTGLLASDRVVASLSELAGLYGGPGITGPIMSSGNACLVRHLKKPVLLGTQKWLSAKEQSVLRWEV